MKVEYDPKHDIMNIELVTNVPIAESIELDGGIKQRGLQSRMGS